MQTFITKKHQEDCIEAIKNIVSYPSVLNEGENGTPFGQSIQDVLEATLELCKSLGFKTFIDPDGYYGYAEVGSGEEQLALLCHLDVVPVGDMNLWETNPFEVVEKDGYLYGRGTQDDKGPSMAALYAVKALMDAGVEFDKRIRFIFGTDEETLWRGLDQYTAKEEPATMGFAPDAEFPLTYAEKGLLQAKLVGPISDVLSLNVGGAYNVVPGKVTYEGKLTEEIALQLDGLGFDYEKGDDTITVLGKSIHSKDAPEGINAAVRLAYALSELVSHPILNFIVDEVGEDATGSALLGTIQDEPTGSLSFNIAGYSLSQEGSEIKLDIRIPVLADKESLVEELKRKAAPYNLTYEEVDYLAPLYVPLDSKLVGTLMDVYKEKTNDVHAKPKSSGGATFARTMQNCVAFGAVFPDSEITFHMENEKMSLRDIFGAMDIYAEAVYRLAAK